MKCGDFMESVPVNFGLRLRLCVFRSLRFTYAQIVSDDMGVVIFGDSTRKVPFEGSRKSKSAAYELGKRMASVALSKGITKIVFDRNGYRYHGRVSAVADGARDGGLDF